MCRLYALSTHWDGTFSTDQEISFLLWFTLAEGIIYNLNNQTTYVNIVWPLWFCLPLVHGGSKLQPDQLHCGRAGLIIKATHHIKTILNTNVLSISRKFYISFCCGFLVRAVRVACGILQQVKTHIVAEEIIQLLDCLTCWHDNLFCYVFPLFLHYLILPLFPPLSFLTFL